MNLSVLFENDDVLVVDKPPGIAVHGLSKDDLDNPVILLSHVRALTRGKLSSLPAPERPGVLHRLDKETSGVMIFAKTNDAYLHLRRQWDMHEVEKEYLALLAGHLAHASGIIDAPVGRSHRHRKKMGVMQSEVLGRYAVTEYHVEREFVLKKGGRKVQASDVVSLVRALPKTGRTHQIRVHFQALHHPVVGDRTYGNRKLNKKFEQKFILTRHFLHAHKLSLALPGELKKRTFLSPLPHDLEHVLSQLV